MSTPKNIFNLTREYIIKCFNNEAQLRHFDRTVYWLKQFNPTADDYLLVAAIGHDIERSQRSQEQSMSRVNKGFLDKDDLREHQQIGAKLLMDFLQKQGCDKNFIDKVGHVVSSHEIGGDSDQNLLKDADSISFLENNSATFLKQIEQLGYEKIKEKFDWMYNRITSSEARRIAKPFYEEIIKSLDNASA